MAKIDLFRTCDPIGLNYVQVPGTTYTYDTDTKQVTTNTIVYNCDLGNCCVVYSRSISEKIHNYCEGTKRIDVYHDGYGGVTLAEVAGGCNIAPVNPLVIVSVAVTHQQTVDVNDGSVNVVVSRGNIAWTLTENFINDVAYYDFDGIFTISNLAPGTYTLKVRDVLDHTQIATYTFTILPKQGYIGGGDGPKWWFDFNTFENDHVMRVEIYGKSYQGESMEVDYIGADPVIIEWKGQGENKYRPIVPTECVLNVIAKVDFEYISIFSSDEREHFVKVLKDGQLFWCGYIIPDVYTEPYLSPPYKMQVSCVDGLVYLKDYPFELIGNYASYIQVITYCLAKLGYDMGVKESVLLMPEAIDEKPLENQYIKPEIYKGLNCYEVLEKVLFACLSRIYQSGGYWYISPIDSLKDTYLERTYNHLGVFQSETEINPFNVIGTQYAGDVFFAEGIQNLTVLPAYRQVEIEQDLGLIQSILRNPEFNERDQWGFDGWSGIGTIYDKYYKDGNETRKAKAFVNGYIGQTVALEPISQSVTLDLQIEFQVNVALQDALHTIHLDFTAAVHPVFVGLLINGVYRTYNTANFFNTASFEQFLDAIPSFSTFYTKRWLPNSNGELKVMEIQSKSTDIFYDFGDVETDGGVLISGRGGEPDIDLSNCYFRVAVYATGLLLDKDKSLMTSGYWSDFYLRGLTPQFEIITEAREIKVPVSKLGDWQTFTLSSKDIPVGTDTLIVRIFGLRKSNNKNQVPQIVGSNAIENVVRKVNLILKPFDEYPPDKVTLILENSNKENLTFTPEKFHLYTGDPPYREYPNVTKIFRNLVFTKSGENYTHVELFKALENGEKNLIRLIAEFILSASTTPTQVITGVFMRELEMHNSFADPYNPGKLFVTNFIRSHIRSKKNEIEIVEMSSFYFNDLTINGILTEDDFFIQDETGFNILTE